MQQTGGSKQRLSCALPRGEFRNWIILPTVPKAYTSHLAFHLHVERKTLWELYDSESVDLGTSLWVPSIIYWLARSTGGGSWCFHTLPSSKSPCLRVKAIEITWFPSASTGKHTPEFSDFRPCTGVYLPTCVCVCVCVWWRRLWISCDLEGLGSMSSDITGSQHNQPGGRSWKPRNVSCTSLVLYFSYDPHAMGSALFKVR
jgi:hypothetical protein